MLGGRLKGITLCPAELLNPPTPPRRLVVPVSAIRSLGYGGERGRTGRKTLALSCWQPRWTRRKQWKLS